MLLQDQENCAEILLASLRSALPVKPALIPIEEEHFGGSGE